MSRYADWACLFLVTALAAGCASKNSAVKSYAEGVSTSIEKAREDARSAPVNGPPTAEQKSKGLVSQNISKGTDTLWNTTVAHCADAFAGIDAKATHIGYWQTGIALAGSLAGVTGASWAAAGRAKSAVSAASGLSGVANTAQTSIQTYLTSAQDEKQAAIDFRKDVYGYADKYADAVKAGDDATARAIASQLAIRCQIYAKAKAAAADAAQ